MPTMVAYYTAFTAGIITFFASCLLPLVPTYIAFLTGISVRSKAQPELSSAEQVTTTTHVKSRREIWIASTYFVLGFTTMFIAIGVLMHAFSFALVQYREIMERLTGILFITFGVFTLGWIQPGVIGIERRVDISKMFSSSLAFNSFLTGAAFSISWSPCVGPILALILYTISVEQQFWQGFISLSLFSFGMGLPFIGIALLYDQALPFIKKMTRVQTALRVGAGGLLLVVGTTMILGRYHIWWNFIARLIE